ncbi:MAG TPA: sulfite exporter TauE/SafE family protein [Verrucomicrobiae bacterium]|nr:sulfite exporter TauE/SafE family protein [Verrucomicrobiae bacterium]
MIVVLTGIAAGLAHVLTGPDHLTAIAPLAVRRPKRAWVPGVRWGLGHSAGVGVVGLLSLWLRDLIPVHLISSWGERLVGVMLFGIGLWALRKAMKFDIHTHEHEHDGERHIHVHAHHHEKAQHEADAHRHTHAAFGIGTLHGLAGSSHFLGVLPMLALPTNAEAISYLIAFGVGTVVAMAAFSWGMGFVATRCAARGLKIYRGLMGFCAAGAMGVGCFWLATSFH